MILLGLVGLPCTTHVGRPISRCHAARHRATPSGGIASRLIFVPVLACRRSVDDRQPGRCGQPCVNLCSWRSVSATRRQSDSVLGGPPSKYVITTRPSANSRPSIVGIGTGTLSPARSRCWRSSVSHVRSSSLLLPRRPTASCPLMRTLHTSLATPPVSGSMRVAFFAPLLECLPSRCVHGTFLVAGFNLLNQYYLLATFLVPDASDGSKSKRSKFITFVQAATKSLTNFSLASSLA
jgi:hypothetical protein